MILVLERDSSDVTVVGLYPDLNTAVTLISREESERGAADAEVQEFQDAVAENAPSSTGTVDFQIESPFLSVDLWFKSVEVREQ